ncbi:MAG: hypothetical protein AAGM33_00340, partial [Pseudomonadota bacterium]
MADAVTTSPPVRFAFAQPVISARGLLSRLMKLCFALAACLLPWILPANAQAQVVTAQPSGTQSEPKEIEFTADTINYDF